MSRGNMPTGIMPLAIWLFEMRSGRRFLQSGKKLVPACPVESGYGETIFPSRPSMFNALHFGLTSQNRRRKRLKPMTNLLGGRARLLELYRLVVVVCVLLNVKE